MPIAVPIFEEKSVKLVVDACIGPAQQHCHHFTGFRMNAETMDAIRRQRDLAIFRRQIARDSFNLSHADTPLNVEEFALISMEMHSGAIGPLRTIDKFAKHRWDGPLNIKSIGLTHHETPAWRRLEEFDGEETTESATDRCY